MAGQCHSPCSTPQCQFQEGEEDMLLSHWAFCRGGGALPFILIGREARESLAEALRVTGRQGVLQAQLWGLAFLISEVEDLLLQSKQTVMRLQAASFLAAKKMYEMTGSKDAFSSALLSSPREYVAKVIAWSGTIIPSTFQRLTPCSSEYSFQTNLGCTEARSESPRQIEAV